MSMLLVKNLLTQWGTEEENQRLMRRGWRWCQRCRWKTSQPWREMGEENQTITSMKNLPTQMGDGGGKPNISGRGSEWSEWSEEAQGFISCCREDASNAWRKAPSHVVKAMRAMRKGAELYPRCERCEEVESSIPRRGGDESKESNAQRQSSIVRCGGGESNA